MTHRSPQYTRVSAMRLYFYFFSLAKPLKKIFYNIPNKSKRLHGNFFAFLNHKNSFNDRPIMKLLTVLLIIPSPFHLPSFLHANSSFPSFALPCRTVYKKVKRHLQKHSRHPSIPESHVRYTHEYLYLLIYNYPYITN